MSKVLVENLKVGMKLSKPIVNDAGMVMLGAGTELTRSAIERLGAMNIAAVHVEGSSAPGKSKEHLLSELDARFRKTENEPYMAGLKRLLKEHIEELFK